MFLGCIDYNIVSYNLRVLTSMCVHIQVNYYIKQDKCALLDPNQQVSNAHRCTFTVTAS